MPFYKDSLPEAKNRWREQPRQAMKRSALRTRCPACGRNNALRRVELEPGASCRVCRWQDCGYECSPQEPPGATIPPAQRRDARCARDREEVFLALRSLGSAARSGARPPHPSAVRHPFRGRRLR